MIDPRRLFVPCTVCGEETRYLDMAACLECDEPICAECVRQDGFCSDDCYDTFHIDEYDDGWADDAE